MASSAREEWKSHWALVLASAVGFSFYSVMLAGVSLFMQPVSAAFGWSRTFYSSGYAIASVTIAVLSPVVGLAIDRYGSRRVALPAIVATMAIVCGFALIDGSATQWIVMWALYAAIAAWIKPTTWSAAIVGVFRHSRGLALGVTLSGTALAQVLVPPLGNHLITTFGWRAAYVWLGVGWGAVTLILSALCLFDQHDHLRKRLARSGGPDGMAKPVLPGLTVAEAARNSALWRLAAANFVVMLLTIGLHVHLFPILTDAGVSRANAAWLVGLSGIASIGGKLVTGVLLDRYRPNWVGGLTLGSVALSFGLLMGGLESVVLITVAMVVNGYSMGTQTQITGHLTAAYGGMRHFGLIYGMMSALFALASGIGPMVAGLAYDLGGGYSVFLAVGAGGCLLGGVLLLSLPGYPRWPDDPVAAT